MSSHETPRATAPARRPTVATRSAQTVAAAASTQQADAGTGFRPGVILAFVCLGQFMVFLDVSIVNLALPSTSAASAFRASA
jgi:hypothetical protein